MEEDTMESREKRNENVEGINLAMEVPEKSVTLKRLPSPRMKT
jgi:hypothetical protein